MSSVGTTPGVRFPPRLPVAGIWITPTTYAEATDRIVRAAQARASALVAATSVHGLSLGATDPAFGEQLNDFDMLPPDGQPVRWALNLLHGAGLRDRVYGPNLMLQVCQAAAREGVGIYLYGGRPEVLERLAERLRSAIPALHIAGRRSPPFRPTTREEDADDVQDIVESGAGIVFVGLGCPRQEQWARSHRDAISAPLVCVGAAFDFHAGTLRQAPGWMQARGLEWLFRLIMEPRRLWRRYVRAIPVFVVLVARQYAADRLKRRAVARVG